MMTIRAAKFTPEVLLSAPRRSAGSPNSSGKLVLYTVSALISPGQAREGGGGKRSGQGLAGITEGHRS